MRKLTPRKEKLLLSHKAGSPLTWEEDIGLLTLYRTTHHLQRLEGSCPHSQGYSLSELGYQPRSAGFRVHSAHSTMEPVGPVF